MKRILLLATIGLVFISGTNSSRNRVRERTQSVRDFRTALTMPELVNQQRSLNDISHHLLSAAADIAPKWRYAYGFLVHDKDYYSKRLDLSHSYTKQRLPWVMPWPTVNFVQEGGGAAYTGMDINDRILSINGESVEGESAEQILAQLTRLGRLHTRTVHVATSRHSRILVNGVRGTPFADYQVSILDDLEVDGFFEKGHIVLSRGMLLYTKDVNDRALIFAYLLAKGILRDSGQIVTAEAADELALCLLARADYPIDHVASFWTDFHTHSRKEIQADHFVEHNPVTPERVARIRELTAEVQQKLVDEVVLWPESLTVRETEV